MPAGSSPAAPRREAPRPGLRAPASRSACTAARARRAVAWTPRHPRRTLDRPPRQTPLPPGWSTARAGRVA
eukprot:6067357-Pleurochrysis_carterae.AAC.1